MGIESRMVVAGHWEGGKYQSCLMCIVSAMRDDKVLEIYCTTMRIVNNTVLHSFKVVKRVNLWVFCFVLPHT